MTERLVYRVVVTDNIVCTLDKVPYAPEMQVSDDELEVSTRLSQNNLRNGRLDGTYYFEDPGRARQFAILCLDFAKRLIDRTIDRLEAADFPGELPCGNPRHRHD
jgi:hypothetical protein